MEVEKYEDKDGTALLSKYPAAPRIARAARTEVVATQTPLLALIGLVHPAILFGVDNNPSTKLLPTLPP
jgi:hypothetical protein